MANYQSFPGVAGDSATPDKLKALRMPSLKGLTFLDVGCNEGFFCGYAKFEGAVRSVGLDQSEVFIERARQRFGQCEFIQQSWDQLPQGPFDVILLASALHYADDQPELIHRLMRHLSPEGTLVLEIGVVSSTKSEWVKVNRGIDQRLFATMPKMREILEDYAWKYIGPSVGQQGDPVPRHVIHVRRRKPFAYLLMQPPAYGKTTISRVLFERAGVQIVAGDLVFSRIARGQLDAPADLKQFVHDHFNPASIDQMTKRIFKEGLEIRLIELFLSIAQGRDFVLDSYVPEECHQKIVNHLREQGYFPILMQWELVGEPLCSISQSEKRADAFYRELEKTPTEYREPLQKSARINGTVGYLERLSISNGLLQVSGWSLDESGEMPVLLEVHVGREKFLFREFTKVNRGDVQRHFGLNRALCGFSLNLQVPKGLTDSEIKESLQVFVGNSHDRLHPLKRIQEAGRQGGKPGKSFLGHLRRFVKRLEPRRH